MKLRLHTLLTILGAPCLGAGASPLQVQDNFQLHKTDEEAIQYFRDLINTSMTAMFPQMFETMHKWAQYMRK